VTEHDATRAGTERSTAGTGRLLSAMLVEEWRLHQRLFGGRRFATFPLFVLLLSAGGFVLLFETGAAGTRCGTSSVT